MQYAELLTWINANGATVGLVCALVGFWFGFRGNFWLARRVEWNAVADRIRADLLASRRYGNWDLRISDEDVDLLLHQASRGLRARISDVLARHAQIQQACQRGSNGSVDYMPEQISEMEALREKLIELVRRR